MKIKQLRLLYQKPLQDLNPINMRLLLNNILKLITATIVLTLLQSNFKNIKGIEPFCGFNSKNGFYSEKEDTVLNAKEVKKDDPSGIADVVSEIMKILQVDVLINVYIVKNTNNCAATTTGGGGRILIIDSNFLAEVNQKSGTEWAAISIIAHEVGHHISGFGRYDSSLKSELDADYWSGFILQKLGASEEASVKCMKQYGTSTNTKTHPNKTARIESIKEGYRDSANGKMDNSKCENC
jgi:hypothetical protein